MAMSLSLSILIQENRLSCISYRVFSIQQKSKTVSQTRDDSNGTTQTLPFRSQMRFLRHFDFRDKQCV